MKLLTIDKPRHTNIKTAPLTYFYEVGQFLYTCDILHTMNLKKQSKEHASERFLKGILRTTTKGVGYVIVEDNDEDIEIEPSFLNTGLNGDEVQVLLHPKVPGKRTTGEITKIILRAKMEFVGTLEGGKGKGFFFLDPQDPKMYVDIFIPGAKAKNAKDGQKALVKITKWDNQKKNPEGEVLEVLGKPGDNNVEMEAIVLDKGLRIDFPAQVEKAAKEIQRKVILVSGDGDYKMLVDFLIEENKFEKILFPNQEKSSSLYKKITRKYFDDLSRDSIRHKIGKRKGGLR